ncbi:MAG: hypothetical protein ACYCQJ_01140 [Nitrososphaerales archaeon]
MNQRLKRRSKRGVSSVIGGIFVLAIIVLGVTSVVYISTLENGVHQAANSAAQIDTKKNQEKLDILSTAFGGSENYGASSSYVSSQSAGCFTPPITQVCGLSVTTGSGLSWGSTRLCVSGTEACGASPPNPYTLGTREPSYTPFNVTSETTTGYQEALGNMNFSNNINGWTVYSTSPAVIGGFIATQGNPTPGSGVGSMFFASTCVKLSSTNGNESTRFFVDPSSSGVGTITAASFSWAEYSPFVNLPSNTNLQVSIYLLDETTSQEYTLATYTTTGDTQWTYNRQIASVTPYPSGSSTPISSILAQKGFYDIIIDSTVTWGSCTSSSPQLFAYYDDVGLNFGYQSFVTDWNYAFHVSQVPTSIKGISFSITTFYNQSGVTQYIYIYNWVLNNYELYSSTTVSTEPSTVSVSTSVTNTGQFSVQNLVSNSGIIEIRAYSTRASALTTGALGNNMETDVGSADGTGFSISITYTSQNAFTVSIYNAGPQPLEVVALGIIDSTGHSYINASGIVYANDTFSTAITYDVVVYPLQTVTTQIAYAWTPGAMSLSFVTARGNVFTESVEASS